MKLIVYYVALLVFIILITGFLFPNQAEEMSMEKVLSVCALLVVYTVVLSVVGEGPGLDERGVQHRGIANRAGLLAGTAVFSVGILYQLFNHHVDYWLLVGLIAINLVKIFTLIYLHYKN